VTTHLTITFTTLDLDQLVTEAPQLRLRGNDGVDVFEPQVLVGHVCAPDSARVQLEGYAILMDLAHYDGREKRWHRCLFSEASADTLAELAQEGQFPYSFEAVPSAGYLETLEARDGGRRPPALLLRAWSNPASIEALARTVDRGLIASSWLRRAVVGEAK